MKSVSNPESAKFQTEATKMGCSHKMLSQDIFTEQMVQVHDNVKIQACGLLISPKHPHIGASTDAVMTHDCCGTNPVEIKCPYCKKDTVLKDANCLQGENGDLNLSKAHHYY